MRRLPPMGAIEAFVLVAHNRTLTAASAELNLSVSAISRRIQSLEAYVGAPLFDRLHHELKLTPTGEQLLENAAPVFDALSQVLADLHHDGARRLTIGVPPSFGSAWLLPRIARFRAANPEIDLSFDSGGAPLSRLGGTLDAAIIFAEAIEGDYFARPLKRQSGFAISAPGLVPPGTTPREALRTQTFLLHSGLPGVLPAWLEAMGLRDEKPVRTEYYDSGPLLLAAAQHGLGITLTLGDMVNFYGGDDRFERPFGESVETPYSYYFVCRPSAAGGRSLRRFRDWLFDENRRDEELVISATDVAQSASDANAFA